MNNSYKIPFIPSGTCPESPLSDASGSEFGIMPDLAAINISSYVGFSLAKANTTRVQITRTCVAMTTALQDCGRWAQSVVNVGMGVSLDFNVYVYDQNFS